MHPRVSERETGKRKYIVDNIILWQLIKDLAADDKGKMRCIDMLGNKGNVPGDRGTSLQSHH